MKCRWFSIILRIVTLKSIWQRSPSKELESYNEIREWVLNSNNITAIESWMKYDGIPSGAVLLWTAQFFLSFHLSLLSDVPGFLLISTCCTLACYQNKEALPDILKCDSNNGATESRIWNYQDPLQWMQD